MRVVHRATYMYPCTPVYIHTSLGRSTMLDTSTVGIVSVPKKRSSLEKSRRELSDDPPVGNDILLLVEKSILLLAEKSSLEKRPVWVR